MDFRISCSCGHSITVTEGAAGRAIDCPCGRVIKVPSFKEMRLQAGLPAYNISPEAEIEQMLPAGQLPGSKTCVVCGKETDNSIQVLTECERAWSKHSGGFSWLTLLVTSLWFPVRVWLWEGVDEQEYGRDKVYSLPLPVCEPCECAVRGQKAIKKCLREIPEYNRLLEKFPDARVAVR
jgi:hypothetical protein